MKTSTLQNLTDNLAQFVWASLTSFWGVKTQPLPPLYFFLSPRSKASLKGRSLYEIDLVHRQQFLGEGITLRFPPQAYVSRLSQVPEEVAHLFALTFQKSTVRSSVSSLKQHPSLHEELWSMTVHECFGKFSSLLFCGETPHSISRPQRRMKNPHDLWEFAHREGYYLARRLLTAYLNESISRVELQKWFRLNWHSRTRPTALHFLYDLLEETPPTQDFTKIARRPS